MLASLADHTKPHPPWNEPADGKIRFSFDKLLDFFSKLEYLLSIGLLTDKEIDYFRYYIDKAGRNEAVVNYVIAYNFPLHRRLHPKLDSTQRDGT